MQIGILIGIICFGIVALLGSMYLVYRIKNLKYKRNSDIGEEISRHGHNRQEIVKGGKRINVTLEISRYDDNLKGYGKKSYLFEDFE